jgi:hypothetical protein
VVAGGYESSFGDERYSCRKRRCQSMTKETTGTISQSHLIVYKKRIERSCCCGHKLQLLLERKMVTSS